MYTRITGTEIRMASEDGAPSPNASEGGRRLAAAMGLTQLMLPFRLSEITHSTAGALVA